MKLLFYIFLLAIGSSLAHDYIYEFASTKMLSCIVCPFVPLFPATGRIYQPILEKFGEQDPKIELTYIKVNLTSLSHPEVTYDDGARKVTIKFEWYQVPFGTRFRLTAHGREGLRENKES